jgi:hypothetical protein
MITIMRDGPAFIISRSVGPTRAVSNQCPNPQKKLGLVPAVTMACASGLQPPSGKVESGLALFSVWLAFSVAKHIDRGR